MKKPCSDRTRKIIREILNGKTFTLAGKERGLHYVTIRTIFMKGILRIAPDLWEEGKAAQWCGAYATPSVVWLRVHKDRVFAKLNAEAREEGQ